MRAGRVAFLRDCSGATAIEFAFVVGPLLLLFVGIIEVGRLMWSGHALDEVAIAGARCVGIHAPDCANGETLEPDRAIAHIRQAAQSWGILLEPGDISLATNTGCAVKTGFQRVALSFSFDSVLPGLDGTQLNAEACFPSQF